MLDFQIADDYKGYHPDFFCIPKHYVGALECVLVPGGVIKDRYVQFTIAVKCYFVM